MGTVRELAEVSGSIKAYEVLPSLNPLIIGELLQAHSLMMETILAEPGKFRTKAAGIHKGNQLVHVAPPASMVTGLMNDLFSWMSDSDLHPLILSCIFHYDFEFIHPFADGNGRMGRLWQTLILSKWTELFLSLPLESVVKDNQPGYYEALTISDQQGDCTPFLLFMLKTINETLDKNTIVNESTNATVKKKTPDLVLELITENGEITRQEVADKIGKNLSTVARAIKKLQESGKVKRIGSDKSGHWEVVE